MDFTGIGIHSELMARRDLNDTDRLIAGYVTGICYLPRAGGVCAASNGKIARVIGIGESMVKHSIPKLIKAGCLSYDPSGGRRNRKLRTHIAKWDGGKKRTGKVAGLWVPVEILSQPDMKSTEKMNLAVIYNYRKSEATPADYMPDPETGVHFQSSRSAAGYRNGAESTIRAHREKWLKAGIIERVKTGNEYEDGYTLTDEAYRRIVNHQSAYRRDDSGGAADTALMSADLALKSADLAPKCADPAHLYESCSICIGYGYDSQFSKLADRVDTFTEEGESVNEEPVTEEETVSFEEIRALFHREDITDKVTPAADTAQKNPVSVAEVPPLAEWIEEAITPSESRQTHEEAPRAVRYIAPDFEYGSPEHEQWWIDHADEVY